MVVVDCLKCTNIIIMKNKIQAVLLLGCIVLFGACNGDHSTHIVRDTTANRYGVDTAKTSKTNLDTSKGSAASSVDNSGSGGTDIVKDTSVTKKDQHKK